ncbi:MAG: phosphate propanoyltransferase [Brevinema sp.]
MDKNLLVEKICERMLDCGLVMIEISARHIHLTQDDVYQLFGIGHQLTFIRELSQKGQFLCKERVDITGPRGTLRNVAILGPCRNSTQVELAIAEARKIGIDAPIRLSGDTKDTPGTTISFENKHIKSSEGVIIAKRHIHITPQEAKRLNLSQGESVSVQVLGVNRTLTFDDTIIRINETASLAMHIDIEEANAAGISKLGYGLIQKAK